MSHPMQKQFLIVLLILIVLILGCEKDTTKPVINNYVEVEFPLGKKAVYASAVYTGEPDSLSMRYLQIYSIGFWGAYISDDSIHYKGKIEKFIPDAFLHLELSDDPFSSGLISNSDSGNIDISIDDKWVLYQKSDIMDGYNIFMKAVTNDSLQTDTTQIPTEFYNQFPVYPRIIVPNTEYSVYRPGNYNDFLPVYRHFFVDDFVTWTDIYGESTGLSFSTEHYLLDMDPLTFRGIIDSEGIVVSQLSHDMIIATTTNPEGVDSVKFHQVNRRISGYTNQENLNDLSWYADYVIKNGLSLIESLAIIEE